MSGKKEILLEIEGLISGHSVSESGLTGVSVFVFPEGATGAFEKRGFATGTRQVDSLSLTHTVDKIFSLTLSGGSVFGLEAGSPVTRILSEEGIGVFDGMRYLPIVPTAVIYDLSLGDNVNVDYGSLGAGAVRSALDGDPREGLPGAGAGATVGKIMGIEGATKTTLGQSSSVYRDGIRIGAVLLLNAFGDIIDRDGKTMAGVRSGDGKGFGDTMGLFSGGFYKVPFDFPENTTITVIITDGKLERKELFIVSSLLGNFLGGFIRPYGSMFDGDMVFAISTGKKGPIENLMEFTVHAENTIYDALKSAVYSAEPGGGLPSAREIIGKGEKIGGD